MTLAPEVQPLVVDDAAAAVRALRASGLRISTARRLVIEALFAADWPMSVAHLVDELSLDESSVYRNLEVLEAHGLVIHVHLGHGPGLYALARTDGAEYLYCERCGRVTVVAPGQLDPVRAVVRERFGYTPRFTHFPLVGVCDDCAGGGDSAPSQGAFVHAHPDRGTHAHPHTHR